MNKWVFGLTWAFILAVAGWDTYFAWHYRAVFDAWEMNPFPCWLVHKFGLGAVFGFKAAVMVFITAIALLCYHRRHRLTTLYTAFISSTHVYLLLHYLVAYWRLS